MHDGTERLEAFLQDCRREDVDFIIWLEGFMHPEIIPYTDQCKPFVESGWYSVYVDKARSRMEENAGYVVRGAHSTGFCANYTLSYEGPGNYFASEATAARPGI